MAADPTEIVVGVDDSESSQRALEWAAAEAVLRRAPLVVVYAAAPSVGVWSAVPAAIGLVDLQRERGGEILQAAERRAKESTGGAVEVSTEFAMSSPGSVLVERSKTAHLVVVGSRGRGALARAALGSVSTALVHRGHCPVAVIPDQDAISPRSDAPILLGFDGSAASESATELAFEEAARRGVDLVALHAWWSPGAYELPGFRWDEVRPGVEAELDNRLSDWRSRFPGVTVRTLTFPDQPANRLVEHAKDAQLLIVGSRGHGGVASALLGSVSAAVVQAVRVPVIVARPR